MLNADLNRYGQDHLQTKGGLPYLIAELAFDSETSAWHYTRPRTDKKNPNFRDTVLRGLLDIGLNISKEELMCAAAAVAAFLCFCICFFVGCTCHGLAAAELALQVPPAVRRTRGQERGQMEQRNAGDETTCA